MQGSPLETSLSLLEEALLLAATLSVPALAAATLVSLGVGLLQTVTGVQEGTLAVFPRWIAVGATLAVTAAWMGQSLRDFALRALSGG